MKNPAWFAFYSSIVIGLLIFFSILMLTDNLWASVLMGLGIWGLAYYVCVGLVVIARDTNKIWKKLEK